MESIEDFSFRNTEKLKDAGIKTKAVPVGQVKDEGKTPLDRLFFAVVKNNINTKDVFQSDRGKR